jgi:hypothetical protein
MHTDHTEPAPGRQIIRRKGEPCVTVHCAHIISSLLRLLLSVDTAVFFRTQPINFEGILLSTSEHGFSFGYTPLAICVRPFLNVIRENHSGISIVYSEYCSTVVYKCAFFI